MNRREALQLPAAALLPKRVPIVSLHGANVQYNGVELPAVWPPEVPLSRDVRVPVYRVPRAIDISRGRQLPAVDDFLIEKTDLETKFYAAKEHPGNPLLVADQPWETDKFGCRWALPYSDRVGRDQGQFRAWYQTGSGTEAKTCLAVSDDGEVWRKEKYDVVPGTNIVSLLPRDSQSICLDEQTGGYYMFRTPHTGTFGSQEVHASKDGIHWGDSIARTAVSTDPLFVTDRSTAFWNPFRKKWVLSVRSHEPMVIGRFRRYAELDDPADIARADPKVWTMTDTMDLLNVRSDALYFPQIYNLDCAAYESVLLGLFALWTDNGNSTPGRPKVNELYWGVSRDGFQWSRPNRRPLVGVSEDPTAWNWGNVQSAGGCFIIVGDEIWFYVSGRTDTPSPGTVSPGRVGSMGLFKLRRDGFASLSGTGTATTRLLRFDRGLTEFYVNSAGGEVVVEVLDSLGNVLPGFGLADCIPVRGDRTRQRVRWRGDADLWRVAGDDVKLRFTLTNSDLFAFWVEEGRRPGMLKVLREIFSSTGKSSRLQ